MEEMLLFFRILFLDCCSLLFVCLRGKSTLRTNNRVSMRIILFRTFLFFECRAIWSMWQLADKFAAQLTGYLVATPIFEVKAIIIQE